MQSPSRPLAQLLSFLQKHYFLIFPFSHSHQSHGWHFGRKSAPELIYWVAILISRTPYLVANVKNVTRRKRRGGKLRNYPRCIVLNDRFQPARYYSRMHNRFCDRRVSGSVVMPRLHAAEALSSSNLPHQHGCVACYGATMGMESEMNAKKF